jgi:hypothetical protein
MHPAYAPAPVDFSKAKDSGEEALVVLEPGGVVEGTVSDAEGRPLAGVKVTADLPGLNAVSGVGGKFRIERVPMGTTWIRRQGMGVFGDADGAQVAVENGQPARVQFRSGSVASGSLARGEALVEGAELALQQPPEQDGARSGRTRFQSVTTDEEGRFTLRGVDPGPARLTVNSSGQSLVLLIDVPDEGVAGLDLDLPERIIEGVVLDESGQPMRGACVGSPFDDGVPPGLELQLASADGAGSSERGPSAWSKVTTGNDGRFRVAVNDPPPESLAVCTCAQGCIEVPLDGFAAGDPVTLWFDPRLRRSGSEKE